MMQMLSFRAGDKRNAQLSRVRAQEKQLPFHHCEISQV
jgi:hypothetical protein